MKLSLPFLSGSDDSAPGDLSELVGSHLNTRSFWYEQLNALSRVSAGEGPLWRVLQFTAENPPVAVGTSEGDVPECFGDSLSGKTAFPEALYGDFLDAVQAHCAVFEDIKLNHRLVWRFWDGQDVGDADLKASTLRSVMEEFASCPSVPLTDGGSERFRSALQSWAVESPDGFFDIEAASLSDGLPAYVRVGLRRESFERGPWSSSQHFCDYKRGSPAQVIALLEASASAAEDPQQAARLESTLVELAGRLHSTYQQALQAYDSLASLYGQAMDDYLYELSRIEEGYQQGLRQSAARQVASQF